MLVTCVMTGQSFVEEKVGIEEVNEPGNKILSTRYVKQALKYKLH